MTGGMNHQPIKEGKHPSSASLSVSINHTAAALSLALQGVRGANRLPPVLPPYLAFLNTVSGAVMTTRVLSATDPVRNALPPTTECSPITVSPPRMDAPE